jgi:hypothetical protein
MVRVWKPIAAFSVRLFVGKNSSRKIRGLRES